MSTLRHFALVTTLLLVGAAPACKNTKSWGGKKLDSSVIEVATSRLHLRHVKVGLEAKHTAPATVVMIDVRNKHTKDVSVTLGGKLFDKDKKQIGTLTKQSLRVPKGAWRMFALVDSTNKVHKNADGASVSVVGVHQLDHAEEILIDKPRTFKDKHVDRVILQGDVRNAGKGFARVLVIAAFYDKDGLPMERPFSELRLKIGETKSVQFVGPPGSVRGEIFPGTTTWH